MSTFLKDLNRPLTVSELIETKGKDWELRIVAGRQGLDSPIGTAEVNRPALALAGYFGVFSAERVQLIGLTESSYLNSMEAQPREAVLRRILGYKIPCVIVTTGQEISEELPGICEERNIPLLHTTMITSTLHADLNHYLERRLAPCWTVYGVMVDVFGMGVLIQGKSGVGKSECALELVERGHRLIADDVVVVRRISRNRLIAETPPNIGYHMEIRGIGIIDVELLFGVRAVREEAPISLKVLLEPWDPNKEYERLGLAERATELFECMVPEYVLPMEPGRNIAKLVEVAALTQRLEEQGVNVAREFDQRIIASIQDQRRPTRIFSAIDRLYHPPDSRPDQQASGK